MIAKLILLLFTVHTINSAVLPNGKDVERLGQLFATSLVRNFDSKKNTLSVIEALRYLTQSI